MIRKKNEIEYRTLGLKCHLKLLNRGVFCAPREMFVLSTPMTDETVDTIDDGVLQT